jgi:hypothetical protein
VQTESEATLVWFAGFNVIRETGRHILTKHEKQLLLTRAKHKDPVIQSET